MADNRRSASGEGPAAFTNGDAAAKPKSRRSARQARLAVATGRPPGFAAVRATALSVTGTEPSPLGAGPDSVSVAHCCRVTRRLVGELFELACMGQVLDLGPGRRPQCHIRQLSMYLCRVVLSLSYGAIGRALGRDRSTVVHACAAVEDRRDDRAYDAFVERCERCVLAVFASREAGHGEA